MAARVKVDQTYWVRDVDHANQTMGEMLQVRRLLDNIDGELNTAIDAAKAKAEAAAIPLRKQLEAMGHGLGVFAAANRETVFGRAQSREVVFGVFGFRRSSGLGLQPKTTWEMVLGKLKALAFKDAVRTKEEVDKEAMRQWPDERLALVGVKRIEKEVFWYELKQEEVANE